MMLVQIIALCATCGIFFWVGWLVRSSRLLRSHCILAEQVVREAKLGLREDEYHLGALETSHRYLGLL